MLAHGGSSPRERGPPGSQCGRAWPLRLIPARAGSTTTSSPGCCRTGAHPRASGEHLYRVTVAGAPAGSSPRERGAPAAPHRICPTRGLIPARAGSTPCDGPTAAASWAHPRASGEHSRSCPATVWWKGSSPRERGAHGVALAVRAAGRLIPARAGSTRCSPRPGRGSRAHPRASGEHEIAAHGSRNMHGSSPRERGALAPGLRAGDRRRLIPARAGST